MRFIAILLTFGLVACGPEPEVKTTTQAPDGARPDTVVMSDVGEQPLAAPEALIETEGLDIVTLATETRAPANRRKAEVAHLLSLDPVAVVDAMGVPDFVRRDGPAQVLQYTGKTCVLDIVFYEESAGAGYMAKSIFARDTNGGAVNKDQCLSSFFADGYWPDNNPTN